MQYSQICGSASVSKFAPDSSYFIHFDNSKLYIKECSNSLKNIGIINTPATITEAEISANSAYVSVFMAKRSLIHIYKVEDCSLTAKIEDPQAGIVSQFWVSNSMQLLVFSEYMYKVSIYNLAENNMFYIKSPKLSTQKGFAFSSNGMFMALLEKHDCKDYVSVYYTKQWKLVNTFPLDFLDAVEVKWSPNDGHIIVVDNCINYRLVAFNHFIGQVFRYEPYNFALGIKCVKFSNDSQLLAIGSFDEKIRLINCLTWKEICELDCSNPVIDSEKIAVYKQEETKNNFNHMKNYDEKTYKIPTVKVSINIQKGVSNQGVGLLEFSQDNMYLACRNDNMPYTVWIWDVSSLEPVTIISCSSQIRSIKWTKKENYLCIGNGTDRIIFWKKAGLIAQCVFSFQHKRISIQKIRWSNDGMKALISDKNEVVYAEMIPEATEKINFY